MLVLAWDTATPRLKLALAEFGPTGQCRTLANREGDGQASHGQALAPLVQETLDAQNLTPNDLDLLAVGLGPGSFTGLRVGLALAIGLAFATQKPVVGFSSLAAMALAAGPGLVAPVIDAKHKEIFSTVYRVEGDEARPLTDILALGPEERLWTVLRELTPTGESLTVAGPGLCLLATERDFVVIGSTQGPSAEILATMAYGAYQKGELSQHPVVPLYGRSPQIFKSVNPPRRLGS
jgi:tRNA threonylcarbamoyladenosine biosynthesis protein TsaB